MAKGAYSYEGGKRMSCVKPKLTGSGKMSSKHGCTNQNSSNNMNQGGSNKLGSGTRGFKSGDYCTPGYSGGATAHGKQPK